MTDPSSSAGRLYRLGPAIMGASLFACADVVGKAVLQAGTDVLTMATVRGVVGVALLTAWLRVSRSARALPVRARWISLGLGVLFTGNVYFLFKAIEAVPVPIAILTYFVYPLLTGLAAAATGLERLTWRGTAAALAAFLGLALMIGAQPGALAIAGIVAALAAAGCRVVLLLITRATLSGGDARLITWYSLIGSTALFIALSLGMRDWNAPADALGWTALVALGVTTTGGLLGVYASTVRIGPFRTALFMNLEPLLATIGSVAFLGEVITPVQAVGGAVMIAALVMFQLRR